MEKYLFIGGALYIYDGEVFSDEPAHYVHCFTSNGETDKDRAIKAYLESH